MEKFLDAESIMMVMFIIVAIGFWARKTSLVDDHFEDVLSKIVLLITCPCIILDSVLGNTNLPDADLIWIILGASAVVFIPVIVIACIVPMAFPVSKEERGSHSFTICFSNVAFLGFPIIGSVMGNEAVFYVSIYNLLCNLMMYSVGAWMLSSSGNVEMSWKDQLRNLGKNLASPLMAACVIALFLALFRITDTGVIEQTCSILGGMTAPAVMLVVGSKIAKYKMSEMLGNPWAYVSAFMRLIVMPAVVYLILSQLIPNSYVVAAITLAVAMPSAMVGTVMCVMYGVDSKPINQGLFLSVVFSLITLPLVAMFIG